MAGKKSLDVLRLVQDDNTKFLWAHVWGTCGEVIEKTLKEKRISVIADYETGNPVATIETNFDTANICIHRYFNEMTRGKKAVKHKSKCSLKDTEIAELSAHFQHGEIGMYRDADKDYIWVVGDSQKVDAISKDFDHKVSEILSFKRNERNQAAGSNRSSTGFIKEDSIPVPSSLFKREDMQQHLKDLEGSYKGRAVIRTSKTYSTIQLLYTSDIVDIQRKIKEMFTEASVFLYKAQQENCRQLFRKLKIYIEETFMVELCDEEKYGDYKWTVKGETTNVRSATKELDTIKETIKCENRKYFTDEAKDVVLKNIQRIDDNSHCHVRLNESTTPISGATVKNVIDFIDYIICRTWNLRGVTAVRLHRCNVHLYPWLTRNSLFIRISPTKAEHVPDFNLFQVDNCYVVTLYLPMWKDGKNQEKFILSSSINKVIQNVVRLEGSKILALNFDLAEVEKIRWPKKKYIKQIIGTCMAEQGNRPIPLYFHEPLGEDFKKMTDIIEEVKIHYDGSAQTEINITVKNGHLADEKIDAIVNSTSKNLQLSIGAVSNSILKKAGYKIQEECDNQLHGRKQIDQTEVIATQGYSLSCKTVFHGNLPLWNYKNQQILRSFVWNCLQKAEDSNMKSIAFPALGTGKLLYPADIVAKEMFETVEKFVKYRAKRSLTDVVFVIYPADVTAIQAFEAEEKKRQEKGNSWEESFVYSPTTVSFKVSVIGANQQSVQVTFKAIEECLSRKERRAPTWIGTMMGSKENVQDPLSTEPIPPVISRGDDFNPVSDGKVKQEEVINTTRTINTSEVEKIEAKDDVAALDNTFIPHDDYMDSRWETRETRIEESYYVDVISMENAENDPCEELHKALKQYNIKDDQIIWNPQLPYKTRLKMKCEADAELLIEKMKTSKRYKLQKTNHDAVVNIKAKLNSRIKMHLQQSISRALLIKQSGVGIEEDDDGAITLTGDLTAISAARDILLNWKIQREHKSAGQKSNERSSDHTNTTSSQFYTKNDDVKGVISNTVVRKTDQSKMNVFPEENKRNNITNTTHSNDDDIKNDPEGRVNITEPRTSDGCVPNVGIDPNIRDKIPAKTHAPETPYYNQPNLMAAAETDKTKGAIPKQQKGSKKTEYDNLDNLEKKDQLYWDQMDVGSKRPSTYSQSPCNYKSEPQVKQIPHKIQATKDDLMMETKEVQEKLQQRQQQSFTGSPPGGESFYPQITISQQQGNRQQNYSYDISKGFGNPQLVPGQSLAEQQNMFQHQQQQQRPQQTAPFYQPQNVRPQQKMPMPYGPPEGQQMYPIMYMPPSQPGGEHEQLATKSAWGKHEQIRSPNFCSVKSWADETSDEFGNSVLFAPKTNKTLPTTKEHKLHHSLLAATGPDSKHFTKDCSMHSATILSDVCESEVKAMSLTSIHSDFNLPSNWSAMEDNENLKIVRLKSSDIEYIEVEQQFKSWQDMWHMNILKIERIQNRYLYQQYIAKKIFMDLNNRSGQNNESTLWHGTNSEAVKSINTYGFNRNYCGKNAAAYGNGAYFAVDSTFSAQNTYARPDTSNTKRMYMCKVLVGDYTKGHQGMKVPPQKSKAFGSHILYDSVVDNPKSPMIFVIFHDTQAYPTYLVSFEDFRN